MDASFESSDTCVLFGTLIEVRKLVRGLGGGGPLQGRGSRIQCSNWERGIMNVTGRVKCGKGWKGKTEEGIWRGISSTKDLLKELYSQAVMA